MSSAMDSIQKLGVQNSLGFQPVPTGEFATWTPLFSLHKYLSHLDRAALETATFPPDFPPVPEV